jgi:Uma2 family endonuclease
MTSVFENNETQNQTPHLFRLSLKQFLAMIETEVIPEDARVELLDGYLVEKAEMKQPHANRIKRIYDRMNALFVSRAEVYSQSPLELPSDGRPLPDITLLTLGSTADDRTPEPPDVHLLIEIAETSIQQDRNMKQKMYARDGVKEYWIVNLNSNQLEIYRDPDGDRYASSFTVKAGQTATCLDFPNESIDWS